MRPVWNQFATDQPQAGVVLLAENGWDALILAVAGPARGVRRPKHSAPKEISVVTTVADSVTVKKVPFTERDQEIIDDFLDELIVAAGFDPRPRGYDWYLRLPKGLTSVDQLSAHLNAALAEDDTGGYPAQIRPVFERVIADLYMD